MGTASSTTARPMGPSVKSCFEPRIASLRRLSRDGELVEAALDTAQ